jgi:hypothetical protein
MRIVSQDKCTDVDYNNNHLYVTENEDVFRDNHDTFTIESREDILGVYKTKERALEVMDEINATNTSLEIWKIRSANMSDEELTKVGCPHLLKLMEYSTFYMPKE